MNVDSRKQEKIVSKYFPDGKHNMDDSLNDFKEPKKKCHGPRNMQAVKPKSKPKTKRKIKGQKDIRAVLKNDIIEYTKDFNEICRKSGIDVDSEQLQLAIALSKSLQETDTENSAHSSKDLTVKQRSGIIRKTLQQYGFKVPSHVTATTSRRLKSRKKESKLLLVTEEEKGQIAADKYSQVIFESLQTDKLAERNAGLYGFATSSRLFNVGSNIDYQEIKQNNIFYIENLIEVYPNSVGSLLRDYSEIPGRPQSPPRVKLHGFQVINLELTNQEMDILLSGKLDKAQKIIIDKITAMPQSKLKDITLNDSVEELNNHGLQSDEKIEDSVGPSHSEVKITDKDLIVSESSELNEDNIVTRTAGVKSSECKNKTVVWTEEHNTVDQKSYYAPRCESPDIFDDDLSIDTSKDFIQELPYSKHESNNDEQSPVVQSKEIIIVSPVLNKEVTSKERVSFLDLTECCNIIESALNGKVDETMTNEHENSQIKDVTSATMNPINTSDNEGLSNGRRNMKDGTVTCTQHVTAENSGDDIKIQYCENEKDKEESIDLTQGSSDLNNDTIILEDCTKAIKVDRLKMDLTQSTDSDDSLPFVHIVGTTNESLVCSNNFKSNGVVIGNQNTDIVKNERQSKSSKSSEVFDEFVYEHSRSSTENKIPVESNDESVNVFDEQDLTQSSDNSDKTELGCAENSKEITIANENPINQVEEHEHFDVEEITTDNDHYDYIDIINDQPDYYNISKDDTILPYDNIDIENVDLRECDKNGDNKRPNDENQNADVMSQNSEVFEISDEELNYSVHKSRQYNLDNSQDIPTTQNFNFGGISLLDNIGGIASFRKSNHSLKLDDSCLPKVDIKGSSANTKISHENTSTPAKNTKEIEVITPKNSEFIIKMDQVTPMGDYASMSTPERNTELDKFGLKPLKRKRAIQILTHLYNQTHPLIELEDTENSPSKKQRPSTSSNNQDDHKITSPKKVYTDGLKKTKKLDVLINDNGSDNKDKNAIPSTSSNKQEQKNKLTSPKKIYKDVLKNHVRKNIIKSDVLLNENENYVTNDVVAVRNVGDYDENDWIFQKWEKAKVHSCRVPLHIAFHNYVSSCKELREAILRYDAVNIEAIHKDLVGFGHRYDPKDLLKFLDKKCITVKTADNSRNAKNTQKKS